MVSVSALFVALRLATRWWIVKNVGWDDITIVFAILGTIIGAGLVGVEVHYGFGRPAYYLTDHELREFLKYTYGEWIQTFASLIYGGIPNWYWRLFEVQLGIVAGCIPTLRPGYKWVRTKIRTYVSSHIHSSHTPFSKEQPASEHLEEARTARHLRAHPSNVYSDPPMVLGSDASATVVASHGSEDLGDRRIWRSTHFDVESQRDLGGRRRDRRRSLNQEPEQPVRRSLDVDLRPRFSLDRVDQSLERIDPAILKTIDDARRHQKDGRS
ncbi:MAG: hypothetical protein Q9174_005068 [Haloplaca sp. 1 TL-2023]